MPNHLDTLSKQKLKALQDQIVPRLLNNVDDLIRYINTELSQNVCLPRLEEEKSKERRTPTLVTFHSQVSVFSDASDIIDEPARLVVSPLNLNITDTTGAQDENFGNDTERSTTPTSQYSTDAEMDALLFYCEQDETSDGLLSPSDSSSTSPTPPLCTSATLSDDSINTPLVAKEDATQLVNDLATITAAPDRILALLTQINAQIKDRGTEYLESEEVCVHVRATHTILSCCRGRYTNLLSRTYKYSDLTLQQLRSFRSLHRLFAKPEDERADSLKVLFGITHQTMRNLDSLYSAPPNESSRETAEEYNLLTLQEYYALHSDEFIQSGEDIRIGRARFAALAQRNEQCNLFSWGIFNACCSAEDEWSENTRARVDNSAKCTIM